MCCTFRCSVLHLHIDFLGFLSISVILFFYSLAMLIFIQNFLKRNSFRDCSVRPMADDWWKNFKLDHYKVTSSYFNVPSWFLIRAASGSNPSENFFRTEGSIPSNNQLRFFFLIFYEYFSGFCDFFTKKRKILQTMVMFEVRFPPKTNSVFGSFLTDCDHFFLIFWHISDKT